MKEGDNLLQKWHGRKALESPLTHHIAMPALMFLILLDNTIVYPDTKLKDYRIHEICTN